jgi:membrane protein YqaA with SNARE-associated domain
MNILADFILPAFAHPFMFTMCFPAASVSVLAVETAVFRLVNRDLAWGRIVCLVLVINIASTFAGFTLGWVIPGNSDLAVMRERDQSHENRHAHPLLSRYAVRAFFQAFILTVIIECGCLRVLRLVATLRRPFVSILLANLASYTILILIAFVCLYPSFQ